MTIIPQCFDCKHRRTGNLSCDAFPSGIPDAILTNQVDHHQPFPGDNGIQFESNGQAAISTATPAPAASLA